MSDPEELVIEMLGAFSEEGQIVLGIQFERDKLKRDLAEARALLKMSQCPDCNGSGTIATNVLRGYGDKSYFDVEPEQCQWCDERRKALECDDG